MINLYTLEGEALKHIVHNGSEKIYDEPLWIDLVDITPQEELCVENYLGIDIPTREELQQIEISQRLYRRDNALYMTAVIIAKSETDAPESQTITFVLYKNYFITVRYSQLHTFKVFSSYIMHNKLEGGIGAEGLFTELLDTIIGRVADILEDTRKNIDDSAQSIFLKSAKSLSNKVQHVSHQDVMEKIGRYGRLISKARESLVTLDRLITYVSQANIANFSADSKPRLSALLQDIRALNDYAHFLSGETIFLLDATLGMISIEQNKIIKIVSVMASIFLPPTLIASIYGMNFHAIPELSWKYGYPYAITLMILSVIVPYRHLKKRGWF